MYDRAGLNAPGIVATVLGALGKEAATIAASRA
jgi:hypothetical protein